MEEALHAARSRSPDRFLDCEELFTRGGHRKLDPGTTTKARQIADVGLSNSRESHLAAGVPDLVPGDPSEAFSVEANVVEGLNREAFIECRVVDLPLNCLDNSPQIVHRRRYASSRELQGNRDRGPGPSTASSRENSPPSWVREFCCIAAVALCNALASAVMRCVVCVFRVVTSLWTLSKTLAATFIPRQLTPQRVCLNEA